LTSIQDSAGNFTLGAIYSGGTPEGFFDGMIDEVGVWSRLLTSDEVTTLYNAGAGLSYPFSSGTVATHFLSLLGAGS